MHPVIDISFIISFVLLEVERVKAHRHLLVYCTQGMSAMPRGYLQIRLITYRWLSSTKLVVSSKGVWGSEGRVWKQLELHIWIRCSSEFSLFFFPLSLVLFTSSCHLSSIICSDYLVYILMMVEEMDWTGWNIIQPQQPELRERELLKGRERDIVNMIEQKKKNPGCCILNPV